MEAAGPTGCDRGRWWRSLEWQRSRVVTTVAQRSGCGLLALDAEGSSVAGCDFVCVAVCVAVCVSASRLEVALSSPSSSIDSPAWVAAAAWPAIREEVDRSVVGAGAEARLVLVVGGVAAGPGDVAAAADTAVEGGLADVGPGASAGVGLITAGAGASGTRTGGVASELEVGESGSASEELSDLSFLSGRLSSRCRSSHWRAGSWA